MACLNQPGFRTWEDFVTTQLASAINCPISIMAEFTRNASIDFCRRTNVLRRIAKIDVAKDEQNYYLEMSDCYQVIRVISACLKNCHYYGQPFDVCGCKISLGSNTFIMESPEMMTIYPAPSKDEAGALTVEFSIAPTPSSCKVDDFLFDHWQEAIGYGALARAHAMVGSPWSSPSAAVYFERKFDAEMARCRNWVNKRYVQNRQFATAKRFV